MSPAGERGVDWRSHAQKERPSFSQYLFIRLAGTKLHVHAFHTTTADAAQVAAEMFGHTMPVTNGGVSDEVTEHLDASEVIADGDVRDDSGSDDSCDDADEDGDHLA